MKDDISERIRVFRARLGVKQGVVAKLFGVASGTMSRWESGAPICKSQLKRITGIMNDFEGVKSAPAPVHPALEAIEMERPFLPSSDRRKMMSVFVSVHNRGCGDWMAKIEVDKAVIIQVCGRSRAFVLFCLVEQLAGYAVGNGGQGSALRQIAAFGQRK